MLEFGSILATSAKEFVVLMILFFYVVMWQMFSLPSSLAQWSRRLIAITVISGLQANTFFRRG